MHTEQGGLLKSSLH